MAHVVIRVARNAGIVALFILAAMLGILSGVMFAYAGDLPQVTALDNYNPSTITRIYASNGQVIGEFATQRRVIVGYDDINSVLRQAIIATEDAAFDSHFGINIWRTQDDGTVIPEHDESASGAPELYYVVEGQATFTIAGEEVDAPAGTCVWLTDPSAKRAGRAKPGTLVLTVGAAAPGQAYAPVGWDSHYLDADK